ncbi:O-acetyltransferase OatA [Dyadobacter sp. CECT 9275]|uniref:O-acetyltransferase OatA n=1 Tax=Dyadobacter helix TaxID=2822344 RepID=A0A916J927_9BACT|nr:acyltransferase [Dyadobacter sp. CECT 9275]CAG4992772.1 O-acetyltransferase OatA [Dyadobacter sp. CECT 9275]
MTMDKQGVYFPNLNGIRFIAAFLVIIHHTEQFKSILYFDNYWGKVPFVDIIGKLGVVLFFVLSGFLITYLLLAEEYMFGKISVAKFYIRRMLRIWPLYFLIVILAFFVFPHINLFVLPGHSKDVIYSNLYIKLFLYAIFLPNLVLSFLGVVPYASHTWSIGTEEQFYFIWPVILNYFKKYRIWLMISIISFYVSFSYFLTTHHADIIPFKNIIQAFLVTFNIDCMAIGGIFSILLFENSKILGLLRNNTLFYVVIVITIFLLAKGVYISIFHYEFYSILFGILILNFASNARNKISIENDVFNYLGRISYGLYMYHPIVIVIALFICKSVNFVSNWIIYPVIVSLTVFFSSVSYRYYESFFLRYKSKFSNVISGNRG